MSIEYKCPKCGSTDLVVTVTVTLAAPLLQSDAAPPSVASQQPNTTNAFGDWDDNGAMECNMCRHSGDVYEFYTRRVP